ncbi:hypothetical protein [Thermus scotoductus]|uniref:Uncharacterized protein n=1 Tax=Thermus scotoductus TaxID=37636 RepID=A0A430V243_THESC|nr:hypothetical protein [Thermus scotoductus]RTI16707.1 hypothetical protein CSW27_03300 [Thermus scotoductus]
MVSLCHALAYLEDYLGNRGIIAPPHPHFSLKEAAKNPKALALVLTALAIALPVEGYTVRKGEA